MSSDAVLGSSAYLAPLDLASERLHTLGRARQLAECTYELHAAPNTDCVLTHVVCLKRQTGSIYPCRLDDGYDRLLAPA